MAEDKPEKDAGAAGDALHVSTSLPPPAGRAAVPVVVGVVVLFAILVVVIWQTGVFDDDTSKSDTQVVVAMLTLLGGLIASAFTLVGLLLKHSIDRHSARVAQAAEHSRRLEAREVEARLRLDTSIKAVELLTLPDGQPAPSSRQAGALFVLGSHPLQQLDLAVALLNENWESGTVSSSAAVWVVDRALEQDDEDLQQRAAWTMHNHAKLLPNPHGSALAWPTCADLKWPMGTSYFTRVALVQALAIALGARSSDKWETGMINWFIVQFHLIRRTDDASEVQSGATMVLDVLLEWSQRHQPGHGLLLPQGRLDLDAVRAEIAPDMEEALAGVGEQMSKLVAKLRADWGDGDPEPPPADPSERVPSRADSEPL